MFGPLTSKFLSIGKIDNFGIFSEIIYYIYLVIFIYLFFYFKNSVSKEKLLTVVEGDQKAPFSIATTPRCKER